MLALTGWNSRISEEVRKLAHHRYGETFDRLSSINQCLHAERFLFCAGVLHGSPNLEQITETLAVNLVNVIGACDKILERNSSARICIVGSESGISGSFDRLYASSKAAVHHYVETRRLGPHQQLVAVAPSIIGDAGMTLRRQDQGQLREREQAHPKQRFLTSAEVARLICFLLYEDQGYITNTVVRMNGGLHAR